MTRLFAPVSALLLLAVSACSMSQTQNASVPLPGATHDDRVSIAEHLSEFVSQSEMTEALRRILPAISDDELSRLSIRPVRAATSSTAGVSDQLFVQCSVRFKDDGARAKTIASACAEVLRGVVHDLARDGGDESQDTLAVSG